MNQRLRRERLTKYGVVAAITKMCLPPHPPNSLPPSRGRFLFTRHKKCLAAHSPQISSSLPDISISLLLYTPSFPAAFHGFLFSFPPGPLSCGRSLSWWGAYGIQSPTPVAESGFFSLSHFMHMVESFISSDSRSHFRIFKSKVSSSVAEELSK